MRSFIRERPRAASALAFGAPAAVIIHFAWNADARMNGLIPVLTMCVGIAHAIGGVLTGKRLVERDRTSTATQAALTGAATSLVALLIFTPCFGAWIYSSNARHEGISSYLLLTLFTGAFTFLGAWWILVPVSAAVAWCLYEIHG